MNVLVTGASGFIGSHLVKNLLDHEGISVFGVSRHPVSTRKENYHQVIADITVHDWTTRIPASVDAVVHLAQSRHYREFPEGSEDMVRVNLDSTAELLEWSRKNRVQRFLFASTGNVYDRTNAKLLQESDRCLPDSFYAATKLGAEYLVQQYEDFFSTIRMRLFGVYGPGQKGALIPTMIERVESDGEISLARGSGPLLSPLYISDCVQMILKLVHEPIGGGSRTFNLAGSDLVSLGYIVEVIAKVLRKKPIVKVTDEEPLSLQGSNASLGDSIQYLPTVAINEGIPATILHMDHS